MSNNINFRFIFFIVLVSALGGLMFGYDWVVIGGAKPFYELYFKIDNSPALQGWAMSSALVGCIFGAMFAGVLADKIGRKLPLIFSAVLFTISLLGTGMCSSLSIFIAFRILGGVGIGIATVLSPIYIAEVSPDKWRGRLVGINQLNIVIGILLAQIINYLIADKIPPQFSSQNILESWNGQTGWRWMFWAGCPFSVLFFFLMFFVPESPRWLMKKNKRKQSLAILTKINGAEKAETEVQEIEKSFEKAATKTKSTGFSTYRLFKILLLGAFIASVSQLCGINMVFNYADEIFRSAGFGLNDMLFNIVITGSVNLVFTFVALGTIDVVGRKKLMLIGFGGLTILYVIIGILYYNHYMGWPLLIGIVACVALFAMTIGPGTWVLLSEIFPNEARGLAMSVATLMLWVSSFLMTFFFPSVNQKIGTDGIFWLFAVVCLISYITLLVSLKETKGKSLEEITAANEKN